MDNNTHKISILDIIRIFLRYWLLLLISTFIFLIIAGFYLTFASKTYSVFARVALRTDRIRSSGASNEYVNVSDLMNQQKTFTNEITFLRSTPLIKEVVKDMNLFTSYYIKADKIPKEFKFSMINIYKNSPFIVVIDDNSPQPINTLFYLKILDDERFSIHAMEKNAYLLNYKDESISDYIYYFGLNGTYRFGETVRNDLCSFTVLLNSNYNADLYQGKDLFFCFNDPQTMAYTFQKSLAVTTAFYESSIADLSFEGENLEMSMDFLRKLIDKYIEKNLEKKNYNATNTIEYIDRQLSNFSGSLGRSEQQLQNFQASREVMNIDEKTSSLNVQIINLEQSRNDVQMRHQYLSNLNDYLEANKDFSTIIAPPMSGMSDATLATLIQEMTNLSTERQNLISTNQLRNPRIKTLDANIETIKKVISDNINFSLTATQNELDELNRRINEITLELSKMPMTQRQLTGLEREYNLNNAVYTSLLDKRMQAQIIMASNLPDVEIIEPVRYVEVASPNPKKVGVIAIFLGLFFPSIFIIFVNFLSQHIKTREEFSRVCSLPLMGSIPHNDKSNPNVIINIPHSPIAERFRILRTNIGYYLFGETNKCILVTSTLPGEGKSFIALNIAGSFASIQKKTVLVGFDLRKTSKTLDELYSAEKTPGLSSYLINESSLDEIINKTSIPNLDFIHGGQIPPDPVGLISLTQTPKLFNELKSRYEYIIVDTPPFGLVADSFLLMQYADIKLYISRLGIITKGSLRQSLEEITSKKISNIYSVINDMTNFDKVYAKNYTYEEPHKGLSKILGHRKTA